MIFLKRTKRAIGYESQTAKPIARSFLSLFSDVYLLISKGLVALKTEFSITTE